MRHFPWSVASSQLKLSEPLAGGLTPGPQWARRNPRSRRMPEHCVPRALAAADWAATNAIRMVTADRATAPFQ